MPRDGPVHDQQFRLALEASPAAMLLVDEHGRIALVNVQLERLFGYSRIELLGAPLSLLIPHRFRQRHSEFRAAFRRDPKTRPMGAGRDLYGLRKDGSEVPVEIGLNPLSNAGKNYVLSSIVDISERKRIQERLEQQRNEREVLLKEVYHRVKNNLQVVSSLLNLQAEQVPDGCARQLFEDSRNRVHSIALVHEQLYHSGDLAEVACRDYVAELTGHILSLTSVSHRVAIEMLVDDLRLSVDVAVPLGLIINELVTNALKHAFPGDTRGKISIRLHGSEEGQATLIVADNGRGVSAATRPRRRPSLGVQLVTSLARQLRGKLQRSETGGTTVSLEFPVC